MGGFVIDDELPCPPLMQAGTERAVVVVVVSRTPIVAQRRYLRQSTSNLADAGGVSVQAILARPKIASNSHNDA